MAALRNSILLRILTSFWRVRGYIFRKSNWLILLFLSSITACGADSIWHIDRQQFEANISSGSFGFLKSVDFKSVKLGEISKLGKGAAYYMAQIVKQEGLEDDYVPLLLEEWHSGDGIWKREAGLAAADYLISNKRYPDAEKICTELVDAYPKDPVALRDLVESVYWQHKDRETLSLLDKLRKLGYAGLTDFQIRELALFGAAASSRLNTTDWKAQFVDLFTEQEHSELHTRAVAYLTSSGLMSSFSADDQALMNGVVLIEQGSYDRALADLLPLLKGKYRTRPAVILVRDCRAAYRGAGRSVEGAREFVSLAASRVKDGASENATLFELHFSAGILYRDAGYDRSAADQFEDALKVAAAPYRQRVLWYIFDSKARVSARSAIAYLPVLSGQWQNPAYFSDVIDSMVTSMVGSDSWNSLAGLYLLLKDVPSLPDLPRIEFICAAGLQTGLLKPSTRLLAALDISGSKSAVTGDEATKAAIRKLLELVAEGPPSGYYQILASIILGDRPVYPLALDLASKNGTQSAAVLPLTGDGAEDTEPEAQSASSETSSTSAGPTGTDLTQSTYAALPKQQGTSDPARIAFLSGFLDYHLPLDAYAEISRRSDNIPSDLLLRIVRALSGEGDYLQAVRLIAVLSRVPGVVLSKTELELLYPQPYSQAILGDASKEAIPPALAYAMIREESYFSADIISRAGAVGLTQLMPQTAFETARRMGIATPNLTDPADNTAIGLKYFADQMKRFDGAAFALMAYNAGPTRVRGWIREFGALPDDLVNEAVPVVETRNHVMKVLISTIAYGRLYGTLTPAETLRLFFPSFSFGKLLPK